MSINREDLSSKTPETNDPWLLLNKTNINTEMKAFTSSSVNHTVLRRMFSSQLARYKNYTCIFTDGSKNQHGVGAAWTSGTYENFVKLNDFTSVFQAELYAILMAMEFFIERKTPKILICTDSLSSLNTILKIKSTDPLVVNIRNKICSPHTTTVFLWTPAHAGIPGNERADFLAKLGAERGEVRETGLAHADLKKQVKRVAWEIFQSQWDAIKGSNKLGDFKNSVRPWKNSHLLCKRDERVITRLRIGHTRLTHEHLMTKGEINKCVCNQPISVNHIFTCPNLAQVRLRFSIRGLETLSLDDVESQVKIISYIKAIKYYYRI